MRSRAALAAPVAIALVAGADACAARGDHSSCHISLGPSILLPHGLLQSVARVTLKELYANPAACDPSSGALQHAAGSPDASTTLTNANCTGGAVWCGSLSIDPSDQPRVFGAEADDASGNAVAVGCVGPVVVNQETQPISITMKRALHAGRCDGSSLETETCAPSGGGGGRASLACGDDCQTKEELVSSGTNNPGPGNTGGVGDRADPALVWPSGTAPEGRFVAFWDDKTQRPDTHVALRVLGDDMEALAAGSAPALAAGGIWMTSAPNTFPTQPDPSAQLHPSVAFRDDLKRYIVAFADQASGTFDIHLRTLDANFSADQSVPTGINGTSPDGGGEPGVQTRPAIAVGPQGKALIAWQSAAQLGPGQIVGRTFDVQSKAYGPQVVLSTGLANQDPSVAALSSGWVVVWQSGTGVAMVTVDATGQPRGNASAVSQGQHARVASIGGGDDRFAIAWERSNIFVQRYDAKGGARAGDANAPVNDAVATGNQVTPAIAGTSSGGFFTVAWIDSDSGHVRARFLDATAGFEFNNVTGQNGEFQVSVTDGKTRANPAVTVGGSGPFVAVAWEDQTPGRTPGIYARRFPLAP